MSGGSYFGGSSVRDGKVRRLAATNFKELVERFINNPAPLPYTRKEFFALPVEVQNEKKDGPWISPCGYPYDEEGARGNAHATSLQLLCCDIDEGGFAKDLHDDPKAILEHLWPYDAVVYTTAKSTPEAPRLRIVVPIEEGCPIENLPRIARHVLGRLGAPKTFKGLTETTTASQPAYRPVRFKGEPFTAVLASRTNGISLDVDCLPPEEDEFLDERSFAHGETGSDSLGLTHLPIPGIESVDDVREMFEHLDPDCSRIDWLRAAASLLHQFGYDEEQARAAYDLFVEWSSNGSKFRGENDTYKMWKSLRPYPQGRDPVTLRSLFKRAMDAGWDGGKVAKREKDSLEAWIAGCDDAEDLMRTGPARIAAMAVVNEIVTDAMVMAIKRRLKELTGDNLEKRAIYKEVARERKRGRAERKKDLPATPVWLLPFFYVATEDVFYDYGRGVSIKPEAFNRMNMKELLPEDPADRPANGRPAIMPVEYALNEVQIQVVYEMMYCPLHGGEDPVFTWNGHPYLNTYNPMLVPVPDPARADLAGRMFLKHLEVVFGEKWAPFVADYLAVSVQFPGRKVPWAFCCQSAEGVGKGFLADIMRAVLGHPNVQLISPEVQRSQWNDWWRNSLFNFLNEIHYPGEMRERVMNMLKPLVSDPIITINKRHTTADCRYPNFANCMGFTNYRDALHLKDTTRRWCFIVSPIQSAKDVLNLRDSGHFHRMAPLKDELGPALRYWLLKRKIADDFPWHGPAPLSKDTLALIEESKSPLQVAIEDLLADNDPLYSEDVISAAHLSAALPRDLKRNAAKLSHYLTVMGYERASDQRVRLGGVRTTLWAHREKFVPFLGSAEDVIRARLEVEGGLL
jgi:hypothetical protein